MSTEIDFSGKYSFAVRVHHEEPGNLGEATLRFGVDHWPHLRCVDWPTHARLGNGTKFERHSVYRSSAYQLIEGDIQAKAALRIGQILVRFAIY